MARKMSLLLLLLNVAPDTKGQIINDDNANNEEGEIQ
jgi:hypothetical protein